MQEPQVQHNITQAKTSDEGMKVALLSIATAGAFVLLCVSFMLG